ncbi:9683_t:CDS:1, partial [Gigaspora margarita]
TPLQNTINNNSNIVVICNNKYIFYENYIQEWSNRPNIPRIYIICQQEILILFPQLDRNAIYQLDIRNKNRRLNLKRY